MYEKQLFGRKVLYFKYAPPITQLDDVSDEERPNPPFRNAPPHMRSVYYYWWAFLRENQDYQHCCDQDGAGPMADLYRDFGDVKSDNFMAWWRKGGRNLFCEPPEDQIVTYLNPPHEHDNEHRVLLSIPVTGDIERTFAELRQLLKPIYQDARTRPTGNSRAMYLVHSKPVLTSLHQHLIIWQATKNSPDASHYEIAEMTGVAEVTPGDKDDYNHKRTASASVRRFIRQAKALVFNVGQGRFPDLTPPPE